MIELQNRYIWQATLLDGSILTEGSDLSNAVMVSLIPQIPIFPQHDLVDMRFIRRFCRGFLLGMGGGMKEYVHCIVCKNFRLYLKSSNGTVLITPSDYELYL